MAERYSLNELYEWLLVNGKMEVAICDKYTVKDLVEEMDNILNNMWSDGIDAMGEDA